MNKAFVKENTEQPEQDEPAQSRPALPTGAKNYITPAGHARLHAELKTLLEEERPRIVDTVHWAAKNGDRSENGDYLSTGPGMCNTS